MGVKLNVWRNRPLVMNIFFTTLLFVKKTQKCPTISKNCRTVMLFQIPLEPLYLELRCTFKSDENCVLIIPHNSKLRGSFFIFFSKFLTTTASWLVWYFWGFFKKNLNTPQLGVEWYNKDKIFTCIVFCSCMHNIKKGNVNLSP